MKKIVLSLFFSLLCLSVHGTSLESVFHLGEKRSPRLDKLLPQVAKSITFNNDSTKLVVHEMGGSIVEWEIQKRQKRLICRIGEDQWCAYTPRINSIIIPKANGGISVLNISNGNGIKLRETGEDFQFINTGGELKRQYQNGFFSSDSHLVALTAGGNEIELWRFSYACINSERNNQNKIEITPWKIRDLQTQLPVRNGMVISPSKCLVAAAEGTYRDGEGHCTIIEIWNLRNNKRPIRVFNTGEILGVWNLIFSDSGQMLAVDTQLNAKSGIRVWNVRTGAQLLQKSGFEAYWTRALAFAPNRNSGLIEYLASGDEKGNLRIWKVPGGESIMWVNYPTGIQALAFSPNGEYLAVALWDTTIQILRWNTNEQ